MSSKDDPFSPAEPEGIPCEEYIFKAKGEAIVIYKDGAPVAPVKLKELLSPRGWKDLGKMLGIDKEKIAQVAALIVEAMPEPQTEQTSEVLDASESTDKKGSILPEVVTILTENDPMDFVADVVQKLHKGDRELSKLIWIATLSPEAGYAIHIIIVGPSGCGKSDLMEVVLLCIPDEKRVALKDMSAKSAYYAAESGFDFNGCTFYIDDVEDKDELINMLKDIASNNRIRLRQWSVSEDKQFADREVKGLFSMFVSAIESLTDTENQMLRRYIVIEPDQNPLLNREVVDDITERMRKGEHLLILPADFEIAKQVTNAIKEQNFKIIIPFRYTFPANNTFDRTEAKVFAALTRSVAKSRFKQRIIINDTLLAQPEDFDSAKKLWALRKRSKLDTVAEKILEILPEQEPVFDDEGKPIVVAEVITATKVAKRLNISQRTAHEKLKLLYNTGKASRQGKGSKGKAYFYWKSPVFTQINAAHECEPSFDFNYTSEALESFLRENLQTDNNLLEEYKKRYKTYLESSRMNQSEASKPSFDEKGISIHAAHEYARMDKFSGDKNPSEPSEHKIVDLKACAEYVSDYFNRQSVTALRSQAHEEQVIKHLRQQYGASEATACKIIDDYCKARGV